jgi:adenosine deaminase
MFFTPARHLAAGQELEAIVAGLTDGIERAEAETGVRCSLIAGIDKAFGPEAGLELVDRLGKLRRAGGADRVIGIGADSTELGVDMRRFQPAYAAAARLGLRRTCHAGEAVGVGPENIRIALDILGAERIDHGIAIVDDPKLVARAAAERIPLTVCPTSNIVIANRYATLAEHPLLEMREAGLLVTINTDDPAMMELDLGLEYRRVGEAFDLDLDALVLLAREGIESTWLDESDRAALRTEFDRRRDLPDRS